MAAAVDVISGGRLEFGVGAGWKEVEYQAYGIPFPSAGVRVGQLVDTLEIVRAMWTTERATYRGRHYSIADALCAPKPVQRPHPPILVGAMRPRMLRVVARYADAVNFQDFFLAPDQCAALMDRLREACGEIGRSYDAIRKTHCTYTILGRTRAEVDAAIDAATRRWTLTPEQREARLRGATVGTPDEVLARLRAYREVGVTEVIFLFPYQKELEMLRVMGKEVLPRLP